MSDIPDKLEWDSRAKRWVPYEGTPGRPTAERDLFTGEWEITKAAPPEPTLLGGVASMLPAALERGLLGRAQSTNILTGEPETAAANIAELERRKRAVARPANIEEGVGKLGEAEGVMDVLKVAFENPSAVLSLLGEGLGASIPDFAAGYAGAKLGALAGSVVPGVGTGLGGIAGTAAGFGLSSGIGEYGQFILGSLEKRGIDLANPAEVQAALQDTETLAQVREDAKLAGLSVGAINAVMAGLPGQISKLVGAVPREATKYTPAYTPSLGRRIAAGAGEVGAAVGLGGLGGALPGYIETGEVSPVDVVLGAGVGVPFAAREAYRAVRGIKPEPGIPTRTEFNTREEAEQALAERGLARPSDTNLSDVELEAVAERVVDARTTREVLEARGPEQLALPPPARGAGEAPVTQLGGEAPDLGVRQTPFGRLTDEQVDSFLASNRDLPGMAEILGAENVSLEQRRTAGLDLVARQSGMEPAGKVPYRTAELTDVAAALVPETPLTGEGRVIARPSGRVYEETTARDIVQANRAAAEELPPGRVVGPDDFSPETLRDLDSKGILRPIPRTEQYVRVNEPFEITAPITRDEYRAIVDRLDPARGKFEVADPVTIPQIQGMLRTERGKPVSVDTAKRVLQFFEDNDIVRRGRDERGKPAFLNNFKPTMVFEKPVGYERQPVPGSLLPPAERTRLVEPGEPKRPPVKEVETKPVERPTVAPKAQERPTAPKAEEPKAAAVTPPESTAQIVEHAKQQGNAPVKTGVKDDESAAAATKEVLPETSKVYSERATVADNVEKDMRNLNGPKGMFADAEPKPRLAPVGKVPLDADGLTFMGWFNKHIFTLDYNLAVIPKLKAWGNQIFAKDEIATKIRREARDTIDAVYKTTPKQMALLTDVLEAHSALGTKATVENLPDGSVRIRGKAEDLKMPLQRGRVDVDITIPKDLANVWRKVRTAFDDFYRMRRESELQRFGFDPKYATDMAALKTRIDEAKVKADKTTDPDERALLRADIRKYEGLQTYLEITDNYRAGYLPHIRPSGSKAVALTMFDPDGVRHVFVFDHPVSINRSRKTAQTARREYEAAGWKYDKTVQANGREMFSMMKGYGQSLDQVEQITGLLMNGRDDLVRGAGNRPMLGADGRPIRLSDQMFEYLGELRQRYLAERAGGRYARTKFVPGFLHKWNRDGYVRAAVADYFGAGAEHIANNLTWRTRTEELGKLRSSPDLLNYALDYEQWSQSPEHASAALRAMGFHFALGFNISSALLNGFQLYQSTLPYLAGMGGTLRATRYTMAAMKDTLKLIDFKLNPDDVFSLRKKPKNLTDDEYKFLVRARDLGKFDPILMREFSGNAETLYTLNQLEQRVGNAARKVGEVSSLAFSAVEQAGRLAAMLAAYRMFKADPKAFAKAQKFSVERGRLERAPTNIDDVAMFVSEETMFNGTKANRPAFMRGMWSVPFQFSQYPLMMMQLMMRVAGAGGRGVLKTKEGGLMLGLMLAGIWTTAGVLGLPGVQQASSAINVVSKDLAPLLGMEPTDVQKLLRENLAKVLSEIGAPSDANALNWILKGGFRQLTGISTEKRTALDWPNTDMLSPDITNFMGPAGSIVTSGIADAVGHFNKGNTALGIAALMPNLAARNMIKALHAKPGVFASLLGVPETGMGMPSPRTGESVIKITGEPGVGEGPLSKSEFAAQLIGFTPSRIADIREAQQAIKGESMNKARQDLTDKLASLLVQAKLSEMADNREEAAKYRAQFQNIVRNTQNRDKGKEDPRDRFIPDSVRFVTNIQNQVKRKLEGPFGQEALKRFREQDRPFVVRELRRLYGVSE